MFITLEIVAKRWQQLAASSHDGHESIGDERRRDPVHVRFQAVSHLVPSGFVARVSLDFSLSL